MSDLIKFKDGFVDRGTVMDVMRGVGMSALRSTAAYTRTVSRNSMRKGKIKDGKRVHSKPGSPPFRWGEGLLRKHTLFAFDKSTHSFVVGAAQLGRSKVPKQIEFSDAAKRIAERPHIRPAFEKARARMNQRLAEAGPKAFAKGKR
jgi:hypothetical protein